MILEECTPLNAGLDLRESRDNVEVDETVPAVPPADPLASVPSFPVGADGSLDASGSGGPGLDISYHDEEQDVPPAPAVGPMADDHMLGVLIGTEHHFDSGEAPENDDDAEDRVETPASMAKVERISADGVWKRLAITEIDSDPEHRAGC